MVAVRDDPSSGGLKSILKKRLSFIPAIAIVEYDLKSKSLDFDLMCDFMIRFPINRMTFNLIFDCWNEVYSSFQSNRTWNRACDHDEDVILPRSTEPGFYDPYRRYLTKSTDTCISKPVV
jgi:hypothetical protein